MSIDVHPERLTRVMIELIDDLTGWDTPAVEHTLTEWRDALRRLSAGGQRIKIYDVVNITGMVHSHARRDRGYDD